MIRKDKKEERSLGVTIIAGCIAILAIFLAVGTFPSNFKDLVQDAYFAFTSIIAILAIIVAIYGRKGTLKAFIMLIFNFPA